MSSRTSSTQIGATPDAFDITATRLSASPKRWLVTGAAGFIGSHLVEGLLRLDQHVVAIDNFSTGRRENLDDIARCVGDERWGRLQFVEGDIRNPADCASVCAGVDFVLHQAALGSVPRSLGNPLATHESNATGFLNVLVAARDAKCGRFVYAGSSSTYGSDANLPKREAVIGRPLSPYAVTKYMNELYADVFSQRFGLSAIGLRYFNVFGPRQDPNGAYAAVIPRWIAARLRGEAPQIFGDGSTSRDFCYIQNVLRANILAATAPMPAPAHEVFNVAVGATTTLLDLLAGIDRVLVAEGSVEASALCNPVFAPVREGDIRHSLADISKAATLLGYAPSDTLETGLRKTVPWFVREFTSLSR